tara:strand:- start:154 stop:834 length:681 start_codon:yes stop_codon:yes gene_type:complete
MAFKMSPIGKNKCSYSPMQKKGLINSPVLKEPGTYYKKGGPGEDTKVTVTKTPTANGYNEETKTDVTITPFKDKPKVSMEEAYKNRDKKAYGNLSFPEFKIEATKQSQPKVTTNIETRNVVNEKQNETNKVPEVDYSYLDGLARTHGYKAGDGLKYGTQISSTVGSNLRGGKDPMSREMTQEEANYLNVKAGKEIFGGPMSTFEQNKNNKPVPKPPKVNQVITSSF